MSRLHFDFICAGHQLAATLDEAKGETGLLIVSGGNETRAGAFSGMSELAARIASEGYPVLRFDRRGIGDSEGPNTGFRHSGPDIAAAIAAFRTKVPHLKRIYGLGNCDSASSLMLSRGTGLDGLLLANPWTIENDLGTSPPAAIRARYTEKLRNPRELLRLLSGQVSIAKLGRGLRQAMQRSPPPSSLAKEMRKGIEDFSGTIKILLAKRDRTAQVFLGAWDKDDPRIAFCNDATHAFVEASSRDWLFSQIVAALTDKQAGQFNVG